MMNAMTSNDSELGPISQYLEAACLDTPDSAATHQAQVALERRLAAETRAVRSQSPAWIPIAWATPALVLVMVALVLFAGGPTGPKPVFADVQRYFNDFDTLYAELQFEVMGNQAWAMKIYVEQGGRSRIDMEHEVSYIVDPGKGEMLILMHRSATAQQTPLLATDAGATRKELEWLDRIRDFQGEAERLPQELVRGRLADGYLLEQNGHDLTVWADAEDGMPLLLTGQFGAGAVGQMNMTINIDFERIVDSKVFDTELPAGYRWLGDRDED